jgi:hypothetical protein
VRFGKALVNQHVSNLIAEDATIVRGDRIDGDDHDDDADDDDDDPPPPPPPTDADEGSGGGGSPRRAQTTQAIKLPPRGAAATTAVAPVVRANKHDRVAVSLCKVCRTEQATARVVFNSPIAECCKACALVLKQKEMREPAGRPQCEQCRSATSVAIVTLTGIRGVRDTVAAMCKSCAVHWLSRAPKARRAAKRRGDAARRRHRRRHRRHRRDMLIQFNYNSVFSADNFVADFTRALRLVDIDAETRADANEQIPAGGERDKTGEIATIGNDDCRKARLSRADGDDLDVGALHESVEKLLLLPIDGLDPDEHIIIAHHFLDAMHSKGAFEKVRWFASDLIGLERELLGNTVVESRPVNERTGDKRIDHGVRNRQQQRSPHGERKTRQSLRQLWRMKWRIVARSFQQRNAK